MSLSELKSDAGIGQLSGPRASLTSGGKLPSPTSAKSTSTKSSIIDLRGTSSLAAGLKRIGGRGGTSRLGNFHTRSGSPRRGKVMTEHKF